MAQHVILTGYAHDSQNVNKHAHSDLRPGFGDKGHFENHGSEKIAYNDRIILIVSIHAMRSGFKQCCFYS